MWWLLLLLVQNKWSSHRHVSCGNKLASLNWARVSEMNCLIQWKPSWYVAGGGGGSLDLEPKTHFSVWCLVCLLFCSLQHFHSITRIFHPSLILIFVRSIWCSIHSAWPVPPLWPVWLGWGQWRYSEYSSLCPPPWGWHVPCAWWARRE